MIVKLSHSIIVLSVSNMNKYLNHWLLHASSQTYLFFLSISLLFITSSPIASNYLGNKELATICTFSTDSISLVIDYMNYYSMSESICYFL